MSDAYKLGYDAWTLYYQSDYTDFKPNPFDPYTDDWKDWITGWNSNLTGLNETHLIYTSEGELMRDMQ